MMFSATVTKTNNDPLDLTLRNHCNHQEEQIYYNRLVKAETIWKSMRSEGLLGNDELRADNPFQEMSFMGKEDDGRWRPTWG